VRAAAVARKKERNSFMCILIAIPPMALFHKRKELRGGHEQFPHSKWIWVSEIGQDGLIPPMNGSHK
jgi:hypothetical protein